MISHIQLSAAARWYFQNGSEYERVLKLSSKRNRHQSVILLLRKIGQFSKIAQNSHGAIFKERGTFC
jgi:hypothetical protein